MTMRTIAIFVALFRAPSPAPTVDAAATLAKVQKFYDSTKDLHAKFEQTLESGVGGKKKASGEVWLKKPGKMRWDYTKPEKKLMLADGQTLWVYEPEDDQAFKQDLKSSSLPVSVTFLLGQGKLADEFDVTVVDGKDGRVTLKLVPKLATAAYRYLLFVVDPATGMVVETVIYDQQGGTNRLTFSNLESNKGAPDAKFKFSPPAGTKILSGSR